MPRRQPEPIAAGAPLALAIIAGAGIGIAAGQPSAGLLGGVVVGGLIALALWWVDRRRTGR